MPTNSNRTRFAKIPLPLLLALAVAVGATVIIVLQVNVLPPPAAVVAPIETSATDLASGTSTYTITLDVPQGSYANYPTMAGLGKLSLSANTTGWYYLQNDWVVTVARRSTGDVALPVGTYTVYVREINATHAFVLSSYYWIGVVAKKVQVGTTGWYIYHPVYTAYDTATINVIKALMTELTLNYVYVFQPKSDYVSFDGTTKTFTVYFDQVDSTGAVSAKYYYMSNATSFSPVPTTGSDVVPGIQQVNIYNYVLQSVWALYYDLPSSNIKTAFTISPVQ